MQNIKTIMLSISLILVATLSTVLASPAAMAQTYKCGDQTIAINVECPEAEGGKKNIKNNPIILYLKAIIKFLSGGVAIVVTLMIIVSGIQYIASRGNPQILQSAKNRLANAIIGLLLFIFMFAILNFLIPGGILGS